MHFELSIPDFEADTWEDRARDYYRMHAVRLVEALNKYAPGGLVDAVFAEMASQKASLFRIPYKKFTDGDLDGDL